MVATEPKVLVLAVEAHVIAEVSLATRAAGCVAYPARAHETGVDAIERTAPEVVLMHVSHPAVDSVAFRQRAREVGARILLFAIAAGGASPDGARSVDPKSQLPVIHLRGDGDAIAATLARALREA